MHWMAARNKSQTIAQDVLRLMNANGWSQKDLADRLGVTQGHLSKVINGRVPAGARLRKKIGGIPKGNGKPRIEPWLENVRAAGAKSRHAKAAIEAIARIVNESG
jgi:transcriptional regulator with XRE-family HTH domain